MFDGDNRSGVTLAGIRKSSNVDVGSGFKTAAGALVVVGAIHKPNGSKSSAAGACLREPKRIELELYGIFFGFFKLKSLGSKFHFTNAHEQTRGRFIQLFESLLV